MADSKGWIGEWSPGIGDPTLLGWLTVACYLLAAGMCYRTIRFEYHDGNAIEPVEQRLWLFVFVGLVLLGFNKQLDLQSALTEFGRMIARGQGWYEFRRDVQIWFMGFLALFLLGLGSLVAYMVRKTPVATGIALLGCAMLLVFVFLRAASFHHLSLMTADAVGGLPFNWVIEVSSLLVIGLGAGLRIR